MQLVEYEELKVPDGQSRGAETASKQYDPAGQGVQLALPSRREYVPCGQTLQDLAPVPGLYFPAGQIEVALQ